MLESSNSVQVLVVVVYKVVVILLLSSIVVVCHLISQIQSSVVFYSLYMPSKIVFLLVVTVSCMCWSLVFYSALSVLHYVHASSRSWPSLGFIAFVVSRLIRVTRPITLRHPFDKK
jgi:hypothetical protein